MSISESQLETWSHIGAQVTAKQTHESVRNAIDSFKFPEGIFYDKYLQGSYKNDTNIYGDMDVDLVVSLTSTFYNNLTPDQKKQLGLTTASYQFSDFKKDILSALFDYYDDRKVKEKSKAIQVVKPTSTLNCDVVVCAEYRFYTNDLSSYFEGITLWTTDGIQIVNYPTHHYKNGVSKHQNTNSWYKPAIRIFKNIRNNLVDSKAITKKDAPSYFIECLLYNVPNNLFGTNYNSTTYNILDYLGKSRNNGLLEEFRCQHDLYDLFGTGNTQWNLTDAKKFINEAIGFWNDWS